MFLHAAHGLSDGIKVNLVPGYEKILSQIENDINKTIKIFEELD
jgi:hypothetical protein